MDIIHLSPADVANNVQDRFSADYWRLDWSPDHAECDLVPCRTDAAVAVLCGEDAWLDF